MYRSLRMSQSIMPKDCFCYLHCQDVPFMFDRVWLLSHAEEEQLNQEENSSSTKRKTTAQPRGKQQLNQNR